MMHGVISAPEPEAVDTGAEILRLGGNAIDAAVACALVQGVVDPPMSGIGGWGTMQVFLPRRNVHTCIDFYATAPASARPDMWLDGLRGETRDGWGFIVEGQRNEVGYEAIATPGTLKGLYEAHSRFGRMPWAEVVAPAIAFARDGFMVRPHLHSFLIAESVQGRAAPRDKMRYSATGRRLFYRGDGSAKPIGTTICNRDLATTLSLIARHGADVFYEGEIARAIDHDMRANGGLLTLDDLRKYRTRSSPPVLGRYRGRTIASNPPPGGGLVLIEMLQILDHFDLASYGHNSADYISNVSEVMKCAARDKDLYIGDPEFVDVPIARFVDRTRAAEIAERIRAGERFAVPRLDSAGVGHTTHVSVLDGEDNAVAMTHSLGMVSGVITEGLGFFYNGAMGVFDPRPGRPGSIAPGKRRYTSACPTIVIEDGRPTIVIGAPGAAHIANGVLQGIVNAIDFQMPLQEATSAARFSATSDAIDVCNRIPRHVTRLLEECGHRVVRSPFSYDFAEVHAVGRTGERWTGGADPAADGMVLMV